jgi:hypothetical protein
MTLQQNINSNLLQQFQKLWERIASFNTYIMEVNREIEVVKSHIQELIGIDVSSLATFGDLLSLETNLKQYADNSIPDLSDYATKEEIPDLSNYATKREIPDLTDYLTKTEMYYEVDFKKHLRIKYQADRTKTKLITKIIFMLVGFLLMKHHQLMIGKML